MLQYLINQLPKKGKLLGVKWYSYKSELQKFPHVTRCGTKVKKWTAQTTKEANQEPNNRLSVNFFNTYSITFCVRQPEGKRYTIPPSENPFIERSITLK